VNVQMLFNFIHTLVEAGELVLNEMANSVNGLLQVEGILFFSAHLTLHHLLQSLDRGSR